MVLVFVKIRALRSRPGPAQLVCTRLSVTDEGEMEFSGRFGEATRLWLSCEAR